MKTITPWIIPLAATAAFAGAGIAQAAPPKDGASADTGTTVSSTTRSGDRDVTATGSAKAKGGVSADSSGVTGAASGHTNAGAMTTGPDRAATVGGNLGAAQTSATPSDSPSDNPDSL